MKHQDYHDFMNTVLVFLKLVDWNVWYVGPPRSSHLLSSLVLADQSATTPPVPSRILPEPPGAAPPPARLLLLGLGSGRPSPDLVLRDLVIFVDLRISHGSHVDSSHALSFWQ